MQEKLKIIIVLVLINWLVLTVPLSASRLTGVRRTQARLAKAWVGFSPSYRARFRRAWPGSAGLAGVSGLAGEFI